MKNLLSNFTKIISIIFLLATTAVLFVAYTNRDTMFSHILLKAYALLLVFFFLYMPSVIIINFLKLKGSDKKKKLFKFLKHLLLFTLLNLFYQLMFKSSNIDCKMSLFSGIGGAISLYFVDIILSSKVKTINIKPRIKNIKDFIKIEEIRSPKPEDNIQLPEIILNKLDSTTDISYPKQGMCSLTMVIKNSSGKFLLKIARGNYRGQELKSEYLAMRALQETRVPVPYVNEFFQVGKDYYLVRECVEGQPLNELFFNTDVKEERLNFIRRIASNLKEIHSLKINQYSYDKVISNQLYFAENHYKNSTIDTQDFVVNGMAVDPKDELNWLKCNKPIDGTATLIHGDYRPKNMIWYNEKIVSIIDWAFCDIGDPYYDIAMMFEYFKTEEEKRVFLEAYGCNKLEEHRLEYQRRMIPFINI